MSKMTTMHYLKQIGIFVFSLLLLFLAMVYMQNGTTMVVTMGGSPDKTILQPKVYFSSEGEPLSEKNSSSHFKLKNGQYYFPIPKVNAIKHIRFDPTNRANNSIIIQKITVICSNWFKTIRYELPVDNIKPLHQIKNLQKVAKGVSFSTTGKDPQLNIVFSLNHVSKTRDIHVMLLLTALLIFIVSAYIYHLYRSKELNEQLTVKLILYGLFFAFALFKVDYYKDNIRFGYPPDESMHLKYVKYIHEHHSIVPEFEKMSHYLSHPSLYYEFIDLVYDEHVSSKENIDNFRTLSMLIYIAAFMLILYLGFSSSMGMLGHFVYLSVITSIPMHAYLGGSITNDTLAMLGAIIFILGMKRLIEERYDTSTYLIIGAGAFLAYFSKLTAALLIFFAVLFFLTRMLFTKRWIKLSKTHIVLLVLIFVPILYYQLSIMFHYHALVPTYNHTHPEKYLKSGFFVPEQYRLHLSPYQWLERMLHYIHGGWFGIHSHHSFGHEKWTGFIGLLIAHIFAILALFLTCKEENRTFCLIGKITLLALFSVLVVQYFFSYKAHLSSGYMGGLQPRYLLPFMFAFAIMASIFVERFKHKFLFTIFIILICMHAIYSDFFYFLQYYQ